MRLKRTLMVVVTVLVVAISSTAINACMSFCGFPKVGISGFGNSCLGNLGISSNCGSIGKSGISFPSFPQISIGTGITGNSKSNTTIQSNINSGVNVSGGNSQTGSSSVTVEVSGSNSQTNSNTTVEISGSNSQTNSSNNVEVSGSNSQTDSSVTENASGSNSQINSVNTNSQIGGAANSQVNTNSSVSIGK